MFFSNSKSHRIILLYFIALNCNAVPMIPSTPQNSVGGDSVRGRDGTTCNQGTHVGPSLDFGVMASQNTMDNNSTSPVVVNNYNYNSQNTATTAGGDAGVYARIVIPLGDEPERVNCTLLYNLEIERLKIELENLKKSGSSAVTVE